jgi:hypothetical protein
MRSARRKFPDHFSLLLLFSPGVFILKTISWGEGFVVCCFGFDSG